MAYVTDSLRLVPQGMYLSRQWSEIALSEARGSDDRSADEIVDDIASRLGGGPE